MLLHRLMLVMLLSLCTVTAQADTAQADDPMELTSRSYAGTQRAVEIQIELTGDLQASPPAEDTSEDTSEETSEETPVRETPAKTELVGVAVTANIAYDEKLLPSGLSEWRSARYYQQATAHLNVGGKKQTFSLRDNRRLVLAAITAQGKQLIAVKGSLHRNEYDTLDLWTDSLALEGLLPRQPIVVGESWKHEQAAIIGLTNFESIDVCDLSSVVHEANDLFARCQMTGVVHGVSQGSAVELELDAIYLVDRKLGAISQFNLAIREKQTAGPARPSYSGIAKLRYKATPIATSEELATQLSKENLEKLSKQIEELTPSIETRNVSLGFITSHDVDWHEIGTRGNSTTLRRVDGKRLVAHANIAKLPPKEFDPEKSMSDFRKDAVRAFGNDFTRLVSELQWTNQQGCQVMEVVAEGEIGGVPVEWHSYLVVAAEESAAEHRLAITITLEKGAVEALAGTDRMFVNQLELIPPTDLASRSPSRK